MYDTECKRCDLHRDAPNVCVPGTPLRRVAKRKGELALVVVGFLEPTSEGANPSAVAQPGEFIRDAIARVGLKDDVFYTCAVKCGPTRGAPTQDEQRACRIYLKREIRAVAPLTIIGFGTVAARALGIPGSSSLTRDLLTFYNNEIPCVTTYSPKQALRDELKMEQLRLDVAAWAEITKIEGWW